MATAKMAEGRAPVMAMVLPVLPQASFKRGICIEIPKRIIAGALRRNCHKGSCAKGPPCGQHF